MEKILISWVATNNDFLNTQPRDVNPKGPNSLVHKHFFDYDKHVLLTQAKSSDNRSYQDLVSYLSRTYNHTIIEKALDLKDSEIINIITISQKVSELLREYRHDEIEIFVSPGTATMQAAWYLAHLNLGLNTKLFQTISPSVSKSSKPERIDIDLDNENYKHSLFIKESLNDRNDKNDDILIVEPLNESYVKARRVAPSNVSVLITGGTGTGKERLAKAIHKESGRQGKFTAINCGAFNNDLLESRLFGYEAGAFTGAIRSTKGYFHDADGGTIFLDEIGDISTYMQQTLLRVLSEKKIQRVGSTKSESIDVRVIAATHKNIYDMSTKDEFRSDLYYRLATVEIILPSVLEYSASEKEQLFFFLWKKAKREFKNLKEPILTSSVRKKLLAYPYHGNIREMENIIYGIWAEYDANEKHIILPKRILNPHQKHSMKLKDVELNHIKSVYLSCKENVTQAAIILDISPTTLRSKLNLSKK